MATVDGPVAGARQPASVSESTALRICGPRLPGDPADRTDRDGLLPLSRHGLGPVWHALTSAEARSAIEVTLIVAVSAVVLNTVFGVGAALVLVRRRFPGRHLLDVLVDLPQAVSPIVVGLALILVYGKYGFFGGWLQRHGVQLIFSLPGMVIATSFVSLPLVVRAVAPVLVEVGDEQEQAARILGASSWQTFRRITLPTIREWPRVRRGALARPLAR